MYEKIKEVIEKEIVEFKKYQLEKEHKLKYLELYNTDGCSEINEIENYKDVINDYKNILDFVLNYEKNQELELIKLQGKVNN